METCICGRIFETRIQLGGHHSHCQQYLKSVGRLELRQQIDATNGEKSGPKLKQYATDRKQTELEQWISDQHTCEVCGRIMTEKFGSGRFCSRACANTRKHSAETKERIAQGVKSFLQAPSGKQIQRQITYRNNRSLSKLEYEASPKVCVVCGSVIPFEYRYRQTCSNRCYRLLISQKSIQSAARNGCNNNKQGVRGTAKFGTYNGIHCDSSWELAYVVYVQEVQHKTIFRNTEGFSYQYNNKSRMYFPDFWVDDLLIEIKNYWTEEVDAKMRSVPQSIKYSVLYYDDIKECIKYCQTRYGVEYWKVLYDKDLPSCNDRSGFC